MTHRASKRLRPSKSIHNKQSPPSGLYGRPVGFFFFSAVVYLTAVRGRSRTNMVLHTYSAGCSFTPPMVEPGRIELPSKNRFPTTSPSAVVVLNFPCITVRRQTVMFGRSEVVIQAGPSLYSCSPLSDALIRPRYSLFGRQP